MNNCNWEVIEEFSSFNEYRRFSIWIEQQVAYGVIEEVLVKEPYSVFGVKERWFKCLKTSEVWRLVSPDAPFKGCWEHV